MPNRSRSRGRRNARRAYARGRNRNPNTLAEQSKLPLTNLVSAAEVVSDATKVDLTFDRPVYAGNPSSPGATDIVMSGTSATTRNVISTVQTDPVSLRATLSGSLTQSKTYALQIAPAQGLVVPVEGKLGNRSDSFAT